MTFKEIQRFKESYRNNSEDFGMSRTDCDPLGVKSTTPRNSIGYWTPNSLSAPVDSQDSLLHMLEEYMDFIQKNPLPSEKAFEKGIRTVNIMRVPSVEGFCMYHKMSQLTYSVYKLHWKETVDFMETCFHAIAYEGAAAGILKEGIVSRKLGLADKSETEVIQSRKVTIYTPDNERAIEITESSSDK